MTPRTIEWYFDFISPFVYLQRMAFPSLPDDVSLEYRPVLLAGILGHWTSKGPAEIPSKRRFTYRFVQWKSEREGVPFRMPPAHPFNPISALRLCIALGTTPEVVDEILSFIWREGRDPSAAADWRELCGRLGVENADRRVADPEIKATLRSNTERACAIGVFGVPTFAIDGELFWGHDSTNMLVDYLEQPERFRHGEFARVTDLPIGAQRKA